MTPTAKRQVRRSALITAAGSWLALVTWGTWVLLAHETTPGPPGKPAARWPAGSGLELARGRPNLVVAVHPRCPCTRASLSALGEVLRRSRGPTPSVRVLVFVPEGGDGGAWAGRSPLGALAAIPGVARVDDPGGAEASRFGLATSGQVVVFDGDGRERFSGGVTPGRGIPGPSEGASTVRDLLEGREPRYVASAAFGCSVSSAARVAGPGEGRR